MTDEGAARPEPTIADAERIIRKIEACSGMAAKLVLLRDFIEFSASSSNAAPVWIDLQMMQHERDVLLKAYSDNWKRAEAAEQSRDTWKDCAEKTGQLVVKAEAERDRLQEALRIAADRLEASGHCLGALQARAALGDPERKGTE